MLLLDPIFGSIVMRPRSLPSTLTAMAALMVLLETIYFGSQQPSYSHLSKTISELGETGALHAREVAFGFFLPVGLLVWLALWLVHREARDAEFSLVLGTLSCLGTGYAISAFFPCDPGGPLFGSWRTQVHNLLGFIDYTGTGFGFLLASRCFAKRNATVPAAAFFGAAALMFVSVALLSMEAAFHLRGAIQRTAEVVQFTGVFFVCALPPTCSSRRKEAQTKRLFKK